MDDLRDIPEHSQRAALRAAARRSRDKRAVAVLDATQTQPNGPVTPSLAGDENRRALFLAEVGRRVMAKGSSATCDYLIRVYRMRRKVAWEVIKESRRELAGAMATQTEAELESPDSIGTSLAMARSRPPTSNASASKAWITPCT